MPPASTTPPAPHKPAEVVVVEGENASQPGPGFPDLAPPGLLGRLDDEEREKLLTAIGYIHDLGPTNPERAALEPGAIDPVGERGRYGKIGEKNGLRQEHFRQGLCRTYLEEGIMALHVRGIPDPNGGKTKRHGLQEVADQLGYSYRHVVTVWRDMRKRAMEAEGIDQRAQSIREFILHHLEEAIQMAHARIPENAAYGAIVIRGCEALKEIEGLDSKESRNWTVEDLASEVEGRSPLLLETIEHSSEAEAKAQEAAVTAAGD